MKHTVLGTAVLALAGGAAADAVPLTMPAAGGLAIDFRDAKWAEADGLKVFELDGLTIDAQWDDSVIAWSSEFGLGVRSTYDAGFMIHYRESIRVLGAFGVTGAWIHEFGESQQSERIYVNGNLGMADSPSNHEILVQSGSNDYGWSDAQDNYYVDLGGPVALGGGVVKLRPADGNVTDFSLVGFTAIPLPGAGAMALAGLGLIASPRRRTR